MCVMGKLKLSLIKIHIPKDDPKDRRIPHQQGLICTIF
jgi:hypothetical protein